MEAWTELGVELPLKLPLKLAGGKKLIPEQLMAYKQIYRHKQSGTEQLKQVGQPREIRSYIYN